MSSRRWSARGERLWARFRRWLPEGGRSFLFYAPLFVVAWQVTELTGMLWIPPDWSSGVHLVAFGIGCASFHKARLRKLGAEPRLVKLPAPNDRRARRRWGRSQRLRLSADFNANSRGASWWAFAAVLLGMHWLLGWATQVDWRPDRERLYMLYEAPVKEEVPSSLGPLHMASALPQALPYHLVECPFYLEEARPGVIAAEGRGVCEGRVLFPLWFPWTSQGRELLADVAAHPDFLGQAPLEFAVDRLPLDVRGLLKGAESPGVGFTVLLYYGLYLLIVASSSTASGYTFSIVETLLGP